MRMPPKSRHKASGRFRTATRGCVQRTIRDIEPVVDAEAVNVNAIGMFALWFDRLGLGINICHHNNDPYSARLAWGEAYCWMVRAGTKFARVCQMPCWPSCPLRSKHWWGKYMRSLWIFACVLQWLLRNQQSCINKVVFIIINLCFCQCQYSSFLYCALDLFFIFAISTLYFTWAQLQKAVISVIIVHFLRMESASQPFLCSIWHGYVSKTLKACIYIHLLYFGLIPKIV